MPAAMEEILDLAREESRNRGFRSVGIYHLLWAVHKLDPELLTQWLVSYRIEPVPFVKMLENVLRPRRASGGIPRDKHDAELAEKALELARSLAKERGQSVDSGHLGEVLDRIDENPITGLCDRFCLSYTKP